MPKSGCSWWGTADTNSKWAKTINWGSYANKNWPIGSQKGILQINMPIGRSNGWFCVNLCECATADTKSKCIKGIDSGLMQKSKFGPVTPKRARCTFTRRMESQKVDLMWIHVSMYICISLEKSTVFQEIVWNWQSWKNFLKLIRGRVGPSFI